MPQRRAGAGVGGDIERVPPLRSRPPGRQRARRAHGRAPGGEGDGGDGEGRTQRNGRRARRETRGAAASERSQPPRMPGGSANSTARRSLQLPHRARAEPRPRAPAHPCVSFRAHEQTARRHAALPMSRSLFASSLVHLWSTLPPLPSRELGSSVLAAGLYGPSVQRGAPWAWHDPTPGQHANIHARCARVHSASRVTAVSSC